MPSGAFSTGSHGGGGHSGHHDHHNHHHDHFDHHHNHHNGGWLGGIPFFGRRDYYQPDIYLGPYGGIQVDAGYLPPSAVYKSKPISTTETIATIVCLVCLISALVLSAFFIVFVFGSLTMLKQGHDMEWTAPQQVYVPLKKSLFNLAIVMNFGVDVAVEKHTVDGFQSPITVSVLGSKPNLNASAIVGTYDNLKLSKNNVNYWGCFLTPSSIVTVGYTFNIENLYTSDPKIYFITQSQLADFYKGKFGNNLLAYQATKKSTGTITFKYAGSVDPDDEENFNYAGQNIYIAIVFSSLAPSADLSRSIIDFIKFEKTGYVNGKVLRTYNFNMLSDYEKQHIDTTDAVGLLYSSSVNPSFVGTIDEADKIHQENSVTYVTIFYVVAIALVVMGVFILFVCGSFLMCFILARMFIKVQRARKLRAMEIERKSLLGPGGETNAQKDQGFSYNPQEITSAMEQQGMASPVVPQQPIFDQNSPQQQPQNMPTNIINFQQPMYNPMMPQQPAYNVPNFPPAQSPIPGYPYPQQM